MKIKFVEVLESVFHLNLHVFAFKCYPFLYKRPVLILAGSGDFYSPGSVTLCNMCDCDLPDMSALALGLVRTYQAIIPAHVTLVSWNL